MARFARQLTAYLALTNGKRALKPNRAQVLPNGLASVADGFEFLKTDKMHGEKVVYRIADTPSLVDTSTLWGQGHVIEVGIQRITHGITYIINHKICQC